jgi:pimeloyl-ACP methyl ester carboxylesterase
MADANQPVPAPTLTPDRLFPLVALAGARPVAPAWFKTALAAPHDDGAVAVKGTDIAWRRWRDPMAEASSSGRGGKRGLLFIHGGVAHLGWWDFIAPFFTETHTPVALSLSGMGRSGWREGYDMSTYADEVVAVAEAAGLFEGPDKPVIVGHSFGGFVAVATVDAHGARLAGAVLADSPLRRREPGGPRGEPRRRGGRVYPDEATVLARFSLMPSQESQHLFIIDHIAREAVRDAVGPDGRPGKAWAHDPDLWPKMEFFPAEPFEAIAKAGTPVAFMRGEKSALVDDVRWAKMGAHAGPGVPRVSIPEAHHHLMLDQPIAFVSALRALLAAWPK